VIRGRCYPLRSAHTVYAADVGDVGDELDPVDP